MNNYDEDEEGKRVALEQFDNGTVNQKMWLKACADSDISIENTSKILYKASSEYARMVFRKTSVVTECIRFMRLY